jgi:hypothetical protein
MRKNSVRYLTFVIIISQAVAAFASGKTIVFYDKDFPAVECGTIGRSVLDRALASLHPRFVTLDELQSNDSLADGDLLILPYGSAFPADAWNIIQHHLEHGNLLVLGGRPFFVPVFRDSSGWRSEHPQNSFARNLGIEHTSVVSCEAHWTLQWDEDSPFFHGSGIDPLRVFVNSGNGGRYRGLGFLINSNGDRIAAPVVAEDLTGRGLPPRRRVYLSFEAESSFWESSAGIELVRNAAEYASLGGLKVWLDLQNLALDPGDHIDGAVDVVRGGEPAMLTLEILSGLKVLSTRSSACGNILHQEIGLPLPLRNPGLYKVRAKISVGSTLVDQYTSGVIVRDPALLRSGNRLEAGRDYFRLNGNPYLMAGVNYFSTDPYTIGFFVAGSVGGNAWGWEKDFAEMERLGLTIVRTGIWLNRARYIDEISGAVDERVLRAMEAFLTAAARHHIQVVFTFFAFEPQSDLQQGTGQEGNRMGPGSNPYLDPVSIEAQTAYIRSIVERFRNVPFLSYDLINEPSFSNPKRLWTGNSPNGDQEELTSWRRWLEKRYTTIERLAEQWHVPPTELGSFDRLPLPAFSDLANSRYGNSRVVRAVDYNLFAQNAFIQWTDTLVNVIRSTGSKQLITVGQDEGGVADRVLNQFWASSKVDYTVNHSWWRDDALLWSSVAAKNPYKPNLIGETGLQPVWSMDGSWRMDDIQGYGILERKLVLGFANANAGVIYWDWSRSDTYGLLRRDGSYKRWVEILKGIAAFAHDAQPYATDARLPDVAIMLPQSLQLSIFNGWGVWEQQNSVRALYQYARSTAFVTGEYQLSHMPDAKLIIVPAPWILNQEAWDELVRKVRSGATVLISGRIDANEHWNPVIDRIHDWNTEYTSGLLMTREVTVAWPGGSAHLTYSGDKTTYAERGVLGNGQTFLDIPVGTGRILYCALPLELADQLGEVGRIYRYAMERAGVNSPYSTSCTDPGILICPTQLPEATLYILTSESSTTGHVDFRDARSGREISITLPPGRAALVLVHKDGKILASYNAR